MEINYTLDMDDSQFRHLLSFGEAAEIWGMEQSTLRKAVTAGRLLPGRDCRKFGKQWVVTVEAMQRLYRFNNPDSDPWNKFISTIHDTGN